MEAQVSFAIVAHHQREAAARSLAYRLGPNARVISDPGRHGATWNHRRAIEWAAEQGGRVIILEDDAVLLPKLLSDAEQWFSRFPDHLISFYLGTGCPAQYQLNVAVKLIEADSVRNDHIILPRLIHGVCYSIPPAQIDNVLRRWNPAKPADYAVGDAYGGDVIYPVYSLVDHADGDSVDHGQCRQRRKAWRLNV